MEDHITTIAEMKDVVRRFCEARDWDRYHNAKDLAIGATTEAAELLDLFRFKSPGEVEEMFRTPKARENISDELADVLFFLLRMAQRYDVDLSAALRAKMEKNEAKYPVETVKGLNLKYNEY